jgi:glycosyl transferase family 25
MKFLYAVFRFYKNHRKVYRVNLKNNALKERWKNKLHKPLLEKVANVSGLDRCDINYINLKHREDRRSEICSELKRLGVSDFTRFNAFAESNGALGCSKSHAMLLQKANITQDQLYMICEDDCEFLVEREFIDSIIDEFFYNPNLDVLCLGYNATTGMPVSNNLMITSDTITTSCYLVKSHAVSVLLDSALKSINFLSQGKNVQDFAIDVVWKEAQKNIFFARPKLRIVKQRASHSDIEGQFQDIGV